MATNSGIFIIIEKAEQMIDIATANITKIDISQNPFIQP